MESFADYSKCDIGIIFSSLVVNGWTEDRGVIRMNVFTIIFEFDEMKGIF